MFTHSREAYRFHRTGKKYYRQLRRMTKKWRLDPEFTLILDLENHMLGDTPILGPFERLHVLGPFDKLAMRCSVEESAPYYRDYCWSVSYPNLGLAFDLDDEYAVTRYSIDLSHSEKSKRIAPVTLQYAERTLSVGESISVQQALCFLGNEAASVVPDLSAEDCCPTSDTSCEIDVVCGACIIVEYPFVKNLHSVWEHDGFDGLGGTVSWDRERTDYLAMYDQDDNVVYLNVTPKNENAT